MLGVTDASFADLPLNVDRADRASPLIAPAQRATPLHGSAAMPVAPGPATIDSWGRTGVPTDGGREPVRSRAALFVGLGLGAAALLAAALLLGARSPSMAPSASANVAARPAPLGSVAATAPTSAPAPSFEPERSGEPDVLPSAASEIPAQPLVRPEEPRAKPKASAPPQAVKAKPAAAKGSVSSDVSDFGGRR